MWSEVSCPVADISRGAEGAFNVRTAVLRSSVLVPPEPVPKASNRLDSFSNFKIPFSNLILLVCPEFEKEKAPFVAFVAFVAFATAPVIFEPFTEFALVAFATVPLILEALML